MYKNITVCLDLRGKDETLIAFASYLKDLYKPKSSTLLHGAHLSYLSETQCEADLCVIGQCDRSGLDAFFLGNNAETLMHTLNLPHFIVGEKFHQAN